MKKSQEIELVLVQALNECMGCEYHAIEVFESPYYYEFIIVYNGNNAHYYIRWSKHANYFSDMISLFMAGVNPIHAEGVSKATEYARKLIREKDSKDI